MGKMFLRMLKALILPLIIPSLIAAVGSLDMSLSGKVSRLGRGTDVPTDDVPETKLTTMTSI